jgi:hypothetical protein
LDLSTVRYPQLSPRCSLTLITGSVSFLSIIFGYLCVPELRNRSLEEVETMFASNVPLRKFGSYESVDGVGAAISRIERLDEDPSVTKLAHRDSLKDDDANAAPTVERSDV